MATIREIRLAKKMSRHELATLANVGFQTIQRLETGKPITRNNLVHICKVLGISPDDVVEGGRGNVEGEETASAA